MFHVKHIQCARAGTSPIGANVTNDSQGGDRATARTLLRQRETAQRGERTFVQGTGGGSVPALVASHRLKFALMGLVPTLARNHAINTECTRFTPKW